MAKGFKKIAAIAIAGAMAFSMAACGGSEGSSSAASAEGSAAATETAAAGSDYSIGVVVKTNGNPFFREILYGAVEAGKTFGVEVVPMACQKDGDLNEMTQKIEDLISRGVDAVVVTPQDSEGIVTAVNECKDAGVKFIAVDTKVSEKVVDDTVTYVGVDNVKYGETVGALFAEELGGKGNVILLEGVAGASSSIEMATGIKNAFENYPEINLIADQNADFDQTIAQQKVSDVLQSTTDVQGVIALTDLMALGASSALKEAGLTPGKDTLIYGADISLPALEAVESGEIACLGNQWANYYGYWGVELAVRALNGEEVPKNIATPMTFVYNSEKAAEVGGQDATALKSYAQMLADYDFGI